MTQKTFQNATTQLRVDFIYDDDGNLILQTSYNDLAGTQLAGTALYSYDGDRVTGIVYKDGNNNVLAVSATNITPPGN